MSFPEIGPCHASEFFEYHFSTKCSILDEFSRNLCHASEFFEFHFRLNALFWISFPEIGLCNAPNRAEFVLHEQVFGRSSDRESGETTGVIQADIVSLKTLLGKTY